VTAEPVGADAELARQAVAILDANWTGQATRASARLYPHQWSWDAACVAIAYSHWDQRRAETELRSIFAGQWGNGLLPHIRFTDGARYFPGPEFWQVERSSDAPSHPKTSGIVQPPIHASAAWQVYRNAQDRAGAQAFLGELMPQLTAWHHYLYRERAPSGSGLVEIWHPWESGMDNSPLWDAALARITPPPNGIPTYERIDVEFVDSAQRPTKSEYDLYAYLVSLHRDLDYDAGRIREVCPFVVRDVLFNSLLVQSNRDLAEIAHVVGADPEPFERWAEQTGAALDRELWDEEEGIYLDFDVRAGELIRVHAGGGFSPLYAAVPAKSRAERLVDRLRLTAVTLDGVGRAVPSVPRDDPQFDPALYWRGPVWPMINWVLYAGLRRYGYADEARELRGALLELARREGFWEHYNALTGRGQGTEELSWTAALVLDLLDGASAGKGSGS
jgi:Trehalase